VYREKVQVLWNNEIQPGYFRIGITCPEGYAYAVPGQFVMLRIPGLSAPLLRRPFSIHRLIRSGGEFKGVEILYRVVGDTTRALSEIKDGGRVDIVGPLGRGFSIPDNCRKVCIAGGGIGVAPLLFLADFLLENRVAPSGVSLFIGGRSRHDLLCREDFARLGINAVLTTDDGSTGDQCLITHPLEISVRESRPNIIYACGPMGMLACVADIAESHDLPCQVSIETMMACGIGACLGCAVESRTDTGKYLHGCLDGPVFDALTLETRQK